MKLGEKDALGRVLKLIRDRFVLVRARQAHCMAMCETCDWFLRGKTAMGVAAQHAAFRGHLVVVTREVVTEYDGYTPLEWPNLTRT